MKAALVGASTTTLAGKALMLDPQPTLRMQL
jgi:hypothetical protein